MRRLSGTPLSIQVTAIIIAAVVLATAPGLGWFAANQARQLRDRQMGETERTARLMVAFAAVDLEFDARDQAAKDLAMLRSHPDVEAALLTDAAGRRFAAWRRADDMAATPGLPAAATISAPTVQIRLPVRRDGRELGTLQLEVSTRQVTVQQHQLAVALAALGLGVMALALVAGLLLQRLVSRPIRLIAGTARQISATSDYALRAQVHGPPEIVALAEGLNGVLAAIQQRERQRDEAEAALRASEAQLRQSQKMEAVGRLAGGIAHDFNNILTAILTYAQMLAEDRPVGDPVRADLDQIAVAAERAAGLTRQLLAFSRKQVIQPQLLDLAQVVRDMHGMLRRVIGEDIDLRLELPAAHSAVLADAGQIEQVLLNLVVNARDAMPSGGTLTVELQDVKLREPLPARMATLPARHYVRLAVADTGMGMTQDTLNHLFEPFFTTKAEGKGTGLGLATVFGIVKQTGGDLIVHSALGQGSRFEIYLPRAAESPLSAPPPAPVKVQAGGPATVLLVEDDELVRATVRRILEGQGYTVLAAQGSQAALRLASDHPGPIDLLLTDVILPGLTGPQLAEKIVAIRPGCRILFVSGYTADVIGRHGVLEPGVEFLGKPFTPDSLRRKVAEVLGNPPARRAAPAAEPAREGGVS